MRLQPRTLRAAERVWCMFAAEKVNTQESWQSMYHYDKGACRPRQHYQHKFYTYLFSSGARSRAELTWGRLEFSETARNLCAGTLSSERAKFTDDLILSVCVDWVQQNVSVRAGDAEWINHATLKELSSI